MIRKRLRSVVVTFVLIGVIAATAAPLLAQQPDQGKQQNEFVPVKDLPQQEQLPAAPLVMAAYAFVWVALLVYIWFLWRRVGAVQAELADLRKRSNTKR